TTNSVLSSKVTVNSGLAAPTIAVSNTVADAGVTYETLSAYVSGGSSPYSYNFFVYNSVTGTQIGTYATGSNTYTFLVPSYWTTNTLFYGNVVVLDSSGSTTNSVLSSKVTVNSGLAAPTIAVSNTVTDAGVTYETF